MTELGDLAFELGDRFLEVEECPHRFHVTNWAARRAP
jgi:hypothetical protein